MPCEPGIRMKILDKTGKFTDILEDVHLGDLSRQENDDLQHLILIPKNPLEGKWAKCLRILFYSLAIVTFLSVFLILVREHHASRLTEDSEIFKNWKKSSGNPFIQAFNKKPDLCELGRTNRFDCHPEAGATEDICVKRGCCWNPVEPRTEVPWCFYPYGFTYYAFSNFTSSKLGLKGTAVSTRPSVYSRDIKRLNVDVIYESEDIVRIKITDAAASRFEVPLDYTTTEKKSQNQNFVVKQYRDGVKVFRKDSQFPLFDSTVAPMIYSDQFLQISTSLVSSYLYGLGEVVDSLNRGTNWKRYVLYNRDQIPVANANLYGSHPFFMSLDKSGNAYGVFLANSNAMEVVVQPGNFLTFRTIGGILDLRIFIGPKPSDVMYQYTKIIGRPMIPPYWSLGFHLCRFNYGTLNHTSKILEQNLKAGIPIDVQWNDLDYMRNQDDFTVDPKKFAGLKTFVEELHMRGMRYVPLIDPGISAGNEVEKYEPYIQGLEMNVFIKNEQGKPFIGKVWNPVATVWPDFSHPNVTRYWLNQLQDFREKVQFDGAWIDMNEPSNFDDGEHEIGCSESLLNNPPYLPPVTGGSLYSKTICPSAIQAGGRHRDLHNLYGIQESMVTYKALGDLTGERPFVISRSTFPGQGKYGGHWTGDVVSNWEDMRQTVPQIITFGLFGIPLVGADICGFNGNTTIDLCKRWMQLGSFYPFARNHNTDDGIPQDPVSLGQEVVEASRETLTVRYSLLPYIYTLFFKAHLTGDPVARGLFYEFPQDSSTFFIDTSFMLGSAILVVPILEENYDKATINAYLPKGWWYQHYFPEIIESFGEERELNIPENSIPILYRGGTIIMKQDPALNTKLSRANKFHIQAFLSKESNATGEFYWDDGVSNLPDTLVQFDHFAFKAKNNILTMEKIFDGYDSSNMTLGSIEIRGIMFSVQSAILNNVPYQFDYSPKTKTLKLDGLSLTGPSWTDGLTLVWK